MQDCADNSAGPAVSIIIPTYNRKDVIQNAIDSVVAQIFSDLELIVVDDGSTDGTAKAVAARDIPTVRLIRHDDNRGAAAARNSGIEVARGRWIAFLDSDDTWEPDKLALQVAMLERLGPPFLAGCTGYYLHKGGRVATMSPTLSSRQFAAEILWGCSISPGTTLLVDRRCFSAIGPFDETLRRLEDWDWLLRYADHADMACVARPLAHVHFKTPRPPDAACRRTEDILDAIAQIERKHLPRIRSKSFADFNRFRSSLLVERAAAVYHQRRPWRAFFYVAAALFHYPFRNAAFFRSLRRSLFQLSSRTRSASRSTLRE
jgi:glycosyltransferase involved in cell wall biosynthesis